MTDSNHPHVIACECRVRCADGTVAENVMITLVDGELVYRLLDGTQIDGVKTIAAHINADSHRNFIMLRLKERINRT